MESILRFPDKEGRTPKYARLDEHGRVTVAFAEDGLEGEFDKVRMYEDLQSFLNCYGMGLADFEVVRRSVRGLV